MPAHSLVPSFVSSFVIRLTIPSGGVLQAWDDTKRCDQSNTRSAVDDLSRLLAAR
jgi:hypothetical protein